MPDLPERPCQWCGTPFVPNYPTRKYCSDRCVADRNNAVSRDRQRQKHLERNGITDENDRRCLNCDAPIPARSHANRMFCHPDCSAVWRHPTTVARVAREAALLAELSALRAELGETAPGRARDALRANR